MREADGAEGSNDDIDNVGRSVTNTALGADV